MSQHDKILRYLEAHPEGITPYEAFVHLRITKLATRISEMSRRGYEFKKTTEHKVSADGKKMHYMRYKLVV
jgi:hypothetical protein